MTTSMVAVLGGSLVACGAEREQADCAVAFDTAGDRTTCVDPAGIDERDKVSVRDAGQVAVGARLVVADAASLVVLDGPADGIRPSNTDGVYVAALPGTYRVVEYVRVPCGGPPDEDDAVTITVVGDVPVDAGDVADGTAAVGAVAPAGWTGSMPARLPSPRC